MKKVKYETEGCPQWLRDRMRKKGWTDAQIDRCHQTNLIRLNEMAAGVPEPLRTKELGLRSRTPTSRRTTSSSV